MKRKHTFFASHRAALWLISALLLAVLAVGLTACRGGEGETSETTATTEPSSGTPEETTSDEPETVTGPAATTEPSTVTEPTVTTEPSVTTDPSVTTGADDTTEPTTTEPETEAPRLLLSADEESEPYVVILPAYAAAWEAEAAERLATLIGGEVLVDADAPATAREISVGYTDRRADLGVDFDALGHDGYFVLVKDGKLAVGANSEQGMAYALETLLAQVKSDEKGVSVPMEFDVTERRDSVSAPTITPDGTYGDTIRLAGQVMNGVQMGFADPTRSKYLIQNQHLALIYDLASANHKNVASLVNADGIPYFFDTMDAYVTNTDGETFVSNRSAYNGRANIYRLGYYYYDAHILDMNFGVGYEYDSESGVEPFDVLGQVRTVNGNMVSKPVRDDDGVLSFTISDTADPYIVFNRTFSIDTTAYNAVEITLRCQKSTTAEIFAVAGNGAGFSGDQRVPFSVTPDGEFHTYFVPLNGMADYTGTLRQFRMDIGAEEGELIEISSFKVVRIRATTVPSVRLDRIFHTYADKLNTVTRVVAESRVDNLSGVGLTTRIDAARVQKLVVKDAAGLHDALDGVDWSTAEYVAFDVDRAGIFGYILVDHPTSGVLTVTLADGAYVIDQYYALPDGKVLNTNQDVCVGQRIYTDTTHSFDAFLREAEIERHPLTSLSVTRAVDGAAYAGYDALRGAYRFDVSGTDFNGAYYRTPNKYYEVNASVTGDTGDRTVYVFTGTAYGNLECGALLDDASIQLPVAVEVCKNFCGENEEPLYDHGDRAYGEVIFPLSVKAGQTMEFTVLNLYQNWGKYPLKQLSSIQFIAPYYHLSCGVTETNCIAPYFVFGKDAWTLPDFRSMSAPLWSGQPQHTSIGRLYFLRYTGETGKSNMSEQIWDAVDSSGPVYADISMGYLSDDHRITAVYRHVEMPQTDENRTYYTIELTVNEDITFSDFRSQFSFFSFDGRSVFFDKLGYLDEQNQCRVVDTARRDGSERYLVLGGEYPYFDYFSSPATPDYVNFALILRDWEITLGGEAYTGPFVLRDRTAAGLNHAYLTLDLGEVTLKAGDTMTIHMILAPWGSQNSTDDSNVRNIRQDSCVDPYRIDVTTGTVVDDDYVLKARTSGNVAQFTISGGANNAVVRVYGLKEYAAPTIQELVDGAWEDYDGSVYGFDGYSVYYDGDGTYSVAFVVPMSGEARTFRVVG